MTTAVLMFLSLYNLISCSSEQLEKINLYKNNLILLLNIFPVSSLYSDTNLLNIGLRWPHLKRERTLGCQRNPAHKLSLHCHTARKSVLSTHLLMLLKEDEIWVRLNLWFYMISTVGFFYSASLNSLNISIICKYII